jgi:hypothetical protein
VRPVMSDRATGCKGPGIAIPSAAWLLRLWSHI